MLRTLGKFLSALVLLVAVYAFGILLTAYTAPSLINRALSEANTYLSSQQQLLGADLNLSYERSAKTLFSESGELIVTNRHSGLKLKLPASLSYGFLELEGTVNCYRFLNNLFLKQGILDLSSEAFASFRIRLLTSDASLKLKLQGGYTQDYLKKDFKHLFGYAKRLEAQLLVHRNPLGTVNTELALKNLANPVFTVDRLIVQGVNAQDSAFTDSSMQLSLQGLFSHGTVFDDLNGLNLKISTEKDTGIDYLGLLISGQVDTTRGKVQTSLKISPLSLKRLAAQKVDLLTLVLKPLAFNRFVADAGAKCELDKFVFRADFPGYQGQVRYQVKAAGRALIPQAESFVAALDKIKGQFQVEFFDFNQAGLQVIESLGAGYVTPSGNLFVSDVMITDGNIWLNGKEYR